MNENQLAAVIVVCISLLMIVGIVSGSIVEVLSK